MDFGGSPEGKSFSSSRHLNLNMTWSPKGTAAKVFLELGCDGRQSDTTFVSAHSLCSFVVSQVRSADQLQLVSAVTVAGCNIRGDNQVLCPPCRVRWMPLVCSSPSGIAT